MYVCIYDYVPGAGSAGEEEHADRGPGVEEPPGQDGQDPPSSSRPAEFSHF